MEEPFCKTQSNPVVAPWSFLGDQFVDSLLWMKFLVKISQAILAYLKFLHLVHLAIGFHKVSSNRSSQIDWTEVVVIAFFFWTGAGFKILEALKTLRSSPPQNPHGRLIFFCVQIYLHLWLYLSTPLTHLQNGIPNLLQNGGAWHWHMILFSYKVMLGVYKQVSFYKMECPDGKKKIHKIWFIGGPGPTILNGMGLPKCRVPSLPPYKMVWGHLQNGSTHGGCCLQNGCPRLPHLPTNIKYFGLT